MKETLRVPGYVRYMDDFALWCDDRRLLRDHWARIADFLPERLGLELRQGTHMNRSTHGMDFCGFRIFPGWRVLNRRSRRRLASRLRLLEHGLADGWLGEAEAQVRAQAVVG